MCTVLLPPGDNPTAVTNISISISKNLRRRIVLERRKVDEKITLI